MFDGLRVLSLESRRAKEMEILIVRAGGIATVVPSVEERPLDSNEDALRWAGQLMAGAFDMVVFTTGVGLSYLRDAVLTRYSAEEFAGALRQVTVVARGPKPLAVLHEMGVPPQVRIPEPNTWREIVPLVAERTERRISIQEYGRSNTEFIEALRELGAHVETVSAYRWVMPEDLTQLQQTAHMVARREFDVAIFTTSIQLVHLLEVARNLDLEDAVRRALTEDIVVASVGPIMNAALNDLGFEPDVVPLHPKMGPLVKAAAEQSASVLARKRARRLAVNN